MIRPMQDTTPAADPFSSPAVPAWAAAPASLPWTRWVREGLRAGVLLAPRVGMAQPTPAQMLGLVVLGSCAVLAGDRLAIDGPATFHLRTWLLGWWSTAALVLLAWAALRGRGAVASWFALYATATLVPDLAGQGLAIARDRGLVPAALSGGSWGAWALYALFWAWTLAIAWRLARVLGAGRAQRALLLAGLLAIGLFAAWQTPDRPWFPDRSGEPERARLALSQQAIETQQAAWRRAVAGLAPERPGVVDVYGLVFAPYAGEDVFLRESTLVSDVLATRWDAAGRVLHLVNHASTVASHGWATPENLQRAVEALAARMNREEDLLVVYLTSHGARDFRLAAMHWPLQVDEVTPQALRAALDNAGVRNRVIAISACYSGGWVGPLRSEGSLVMTAADADHTSYGCGSKSELTFFGRALFDEQLRRTHSFEEAFAAAVPVIRQREIEAGKDDGFSNPQIAVGDAIRPVLQAVRTRLEAHGKP